MAAPSWPQHRPLGLWCVFYRCRRSGIDRLLGGWTVWRFGVGGIHACGANTESEQGSSGRRVGTPEIQGGGPYGGRKRAFLGLLMAGLVIAVLGAVLILAHARPARANVAGTWCYTHECAGTLARDDGAPDLVNDGDNDADDVALSVTTPPPPW